MNRYRYAAVCNHADGTGPLAAYFHGELMNLPGASASIFDRNKFLAEDRILAFGKSSLFRLCTSSIPFLFYMCQPLPHLPVDLDWLSRNRHQETGQMETTIREIRQGRYGRSIPCTRIHLSTKKMVERVSRVESISWYWNLVLMIDRSLRLFTLWSVFGESGHRAMGLFGKSCWTWLPSTVCSLSCRDDITGVGG